MLSIKSLSLILLLTNLLWLSVVSAKQPEQITVVSQNLRQFYDDQRNGDKDRVLTSQKYRQKTAYFINQIAHRFEFPDILALQEIENRAILGLLANRLKSQYNRDYRSIMIEGHDQYRMNLAFLISTTVHLKSAETLFHDHRLLPERVPLFTRPPLKIEVCRRDCITIVNVHLRSMRGLRKGNKQEFVARKRKTQAETLAQWIQQYQQRFPDQGLIIIGDFNALNPSDAHVDVIGTILGNPDQHRPKYRSPDFIDRDLQDLTELIPVTQRYSFRYRRKNQQLDYALGNPLIKERISDIRFWPIDYQLSDHAALAITLTGH